MRLRSRRVALVIPADSVERGVFAGVDPSAIRIAETAGLVDQLLFVDWVLRGGSGQINLAPSISLATCCR